MSARRIMLGVGAKVYGQGVMAAVQLLLVPVLAISWGLHTYGVWVLLSTIPVFLSMSDFGFATAAGTQMTMAESRGDRPEVLRLFQSAWSVVLVSSVVVTAAALTLIWLLPDAIMPRSASFPPDLSRKTLALLTLWGIVALQGSILGAGFRCCGQFATGTFLFANTILAENGAAIAVVLAGGGPEHAAAALLATRSAAIVYQRHVLRKKAPWLSLGLKHASHQEARALLPPAIAVMAITLGQASFLQGTVLALGAAAGEAAVPAFTAARTLSRLGLQMTMAVVLSLQPEYSAAAARQDRPAQATLLAITLTSCLVILLPYALILAFLGRQIIKLWSGSVIHAPAGLMLVMAVTVVLGGFWNALSNLILALNRHATYSYIFVVLGIIAGASAYFLSVQFGAVGAGLAIALMDAAMCAVIVQRGSAIFATIPELVAALSQIALQTKSFIVVLSRRHTANR